MYQIGDLTQKTRCFIKIAPEEHEMRLVKEKKRKDEMESCCEADEFKSDFIWACAA